MIKAVHIARYRGIGDCVADGFGRVNLIIGKNDCGKTAFMEALLLGEGEDAAHGLYDIQRRRLGDRLGRVPNYSDFERFWRPIFFDLDAQAGLSISTIRDDGASKRIEVRQGAILEEIISDRRLPQTRNGDADADNDVVMSPTWTLELQFVDYDQTKTKKRIVATPSSIKLPPLGSKYHSTWISTSADIGEAELRQISTLKQRGHSETLLELMREVDDRVLGIELLAPGGDVAELFVRLDNGTPMLPVTLMGEGFQRCLEIGAAAAVYDFPTLFIDEIENGMHHLVLERLWRWIATISKRRNLQVFATTHSDECIQAARRAFKGLEDDGLRVIRLDRTGAGTRATIYDRALIEIADRTGTEIRG